MVNLVISQFKDTIKHFYKSAQAIRQEQEFNKGRYSSLCKRRKKQGTDSPDQSDCRFSRGNRGSVPGTAGFCGRNRV